MVIDMSQITAILLFGGSSEQVIEHGQREVRLENLLCH